MKPDEFKKIYGDVIMEIVIDTLESIKTPRKTTRKPTLKEAIGWGEDKGFPVKLVERAWNYYDAAGWCDRNGKPVKAWKNKFINVWLTKENIRKYELEVMKLQSEAANSNF